MNSLKLVSVGILCLGFICLNANEISQKETLGKALFMDKNLSKNSTTKEVEEEITFETTIKEDVDMYIEKGMSTKDAIKEVAKQRNLNKNSVYQEYHSK